MSKKDHKLLAAWAAKCAERKLPLFESVYPKDNRPRKAIKVLRIWIKTGVFRMADIRKASLDAHKASRKKHDLAGFAAHAVGQAVATAHVPEHAFGAAYYCLKASSNVKRELEWQSRHLSDSLRKEWRKILIKKLPRDLKKELLIWLKMC